MRHSIERQRFIDTIGFVVLALGIFALGKAMPDAIKAAQEYQHEIAFKRCVHKGDFDDSTEYCRAVAKEMGQ